MSDSPMLSKMEALMQKHRGGTDGDAHVVTPEHTTALEPEDAPRSPPPHAWLPVLTQLIERGTPPAAPPSVAVSTVDVPASVEPVAEEIQVADAPPASSTIVNNALAEQLMSELAPRLSAVMEQQVASELRKNLDQTVATLLSQLDVNVREIVRDAVAEKLNKPHDPSP